MYQSIRSTACRGISRERLQALAASVLENCAHSTAFLRLAGVQSQPELWDVFVKLDSDRSDFDVLEVTKLTGGCKQLDINFGL